MSQLLGTREHQGDITAHRQHGNVNILHHIIAHRRSARDKVISKSSSLNLFSGAVSSLAISGMAIC